MNIIIKYGIMVIGIIIILLGLISPGLFPVYMIAPLFGISSDSPAAFIVFPFLHLAIRFVLMLLYPLKFMFHKEEKLPFEDEVGGTMTILGFYKFNISHNQFTSIDFGFRKIYKDILLWAITFIVMFSLFSIISSQSTFFPDPWRTCITVYLGAFILVKAILIKTKVNSISPIQDS